MVRILFSLEPLHVNHDCTQHKVLKGMSQITLIYIYDRLKCLMTFDANCIEKC